jgi:hypothetical protein
MWASKKRRRTAKERLTVNYVIDISQHALAPGVTRLSLPVAVTPPCDEIIVARDRRVQYISPS